MTKTDEKGFQRAPPPSAEARQVIEDYANDLREIIRKLRRSLTNCNLRTD